MMIHIYWEQKIFLYKDNNSPTSPSGPPLCQIKLFILHVHP
ncbi:Protein of unknown function [Pyronema omphalodes CBS 100304]|uniref:Uncharacterized protein n=1 Tax=Pyronema omphalodes (strain CBS 100304) TaxID=1076935 RepID=U4KWR5_PYROM|nr:Protein of unknown function [Pyronema omphalodes CBS 100304]